MHQNPDKITAAVPGLDFSNIPFYTWLHCNEYTHEYIFIIITRNLHWALLHFAWNCNDGLFIFFSVHFAVLLSLIFWMCPFRHNSFFSDPLGGNRTLRVHFRWSRRLLLTWSIFTWNCTTLFFRPSGGKPDAPDSNLVPRSFFKKILERSPPLIPTNYH